MKAKRANRESVPMKKAMLGFLAFTSCLLSVNAYSMGWTGTDLTGRACDGNGQGFGPYDYFEITAAKNSARPEDKVLWDKARLWEIDKIHFGKGVQILASEGLNDITLRSAVHEFDYTLRAYPNHIRALEAFVKLEMERQQKNKNGSTLPALKTPPECYFNRAISFKNNQASVFLLYAIYLHKLGKYQLAKDLYENAINLNEHYSEAHYNYGLLLFELKQFAKAKEHADIAARLQYPLPGLVKKLQEEGY